MNKTRLAWLTTSPIQYQQPIFHEISKSQEIDLTVIFFSDFTNREFYDDNFSRNIKWDIPLLNGFKHEFLPGTGAYVNGIKTFSPVVFGLNDRLQLKNYDAVIIQGWQHYGMVLAAYLAKRAGLKVLLRCEASDHVSSAQGAKGLIRAAVIRFLLNHVDYCMAIGTKNKQFYIDRGFEIDRIGSMPYCVDNNLFSKKIDYAYAIEMTNKLCIEKGRPIILYAGKLIARKYPDILLQAFKKLKNPRPYLLFIGDGELRVELELEVTKCSLNENVRFLGFKNQTELPELYALADIFVLPSINEPWGLAVNEAMSASCAIIVTDQVGCSTDLVISGENGYIITSKDTKSLTEALEKCLDENKYVKMGQKSREIINNWSIKENIIGLSNVLKKITKNNIIRKWK